MRTTITLSDAVLAQAKREAERTGVTLGDLIEKALRQLLHRRAPAEEAAPFRLVTFGGGGLRPGFSFDRLKEIADLEDIERIRSPFVSRAADSDDDVAS